MHTYNTVRLIKKPEKLHHIQPITMLISLSRSRPFFDRSVSPDTLFIEVRGLDNARDVRLPIHYINIPLYKLHPIEFVIHLVSFI